MLENAEVKLMSMVGSWMQVPSHCKCRQQSVQLSHERHPPLPVSRTDRAWIVLWQDDCDGSGKPDVAAAITGWSRPSSCFQGQNKWLRVRQPLTYPKQLLGTSSVDGNCKVLSSIHCPREVAIHFLDDDAYSFFCLAQMFKQC